MKKILLLLILVFYQSESPAEEKLPVKDNIQQKISKKSPDPVLGRGVKLYNLGISLSDVLRDPKRKSFLEFGAVVDGSKILPTFEYITHAGADVLAPVAWKIEHIDKNEQGDFAIFFSNPKDSSREWHLELDHVLNVAVSVGDIVQVGQRLGDVGLWGPGKGRTELMLVNTKERKYYCPMAFLEESVKSQLESEILDLMKDTETAMNNSNLYNESSMVLPGCNQMTYKDNNF